MLSLLEKMSCLKYEPLIRDYNSEQRKIVNNQMGIYKEFVKEFNFTYWDEMHIKLFKGAKIFGFGHYSQMNGKICCYLYKLKQVHNYFRKQFINGKLFGNIVIDRRTLPYQHLVLDFDLKCLDNTTSYSKVNYHQYRDYVDNKRKNCGERCLMTNVIDTTIKSHKNIDLKIEKENKFNTNYFVYEIIYFLTEVLHLNWLPIYILGKNGTFNKGFHIEIPDLIMSYHDIALLSHSCHKFISNEKLLDPVINYSIFGSQKIEAIDTKMASINEMEKTYLPYVKFYKNNFWFAKEYSLGDTFDIFNIIKYLTIPNDTRIYKFRISTLMDSKENELTLSNLLYNNNNNNNNNNQDDTIPEHVKIDINQNNNNNNNNNCNEIFSLLNNMFSITNNNNNCSSRKNNNNFSYLVGYLEFPNFLGFTNNMTLYKNILLNENEDFIEMKDINKTLIDVCMPSDIRHFININKRDIKINIKEIPIYYTVSIKHTCNIKSNFSTYYLTFHNINIYCYSSNKNTHNEESDTDDDNNIQVFLYPFNINHLLKLTFDDYDNRLCNTVFYLFSIYMLSEKVKPLNYFIKEWLYNLGIKGNLDKFLNIFYILKSKINEGLLEFDTNDQNWAILCLKHLLIRYNVLTFDEIFSNNYNNNNNNNTVALPLLYQNQTIKIGVVRTIKIPDIIIFSILYDSVRLNELLALYCPIIKRNDRNYDGGENATHSKKGRGSGGSSGGGISCNNNFDSDFNSGANNNSSNNSSNNNFLLWNINNVEWVPINTNLKKFFLTSPELTQVTKLMFAHEQEMSDDNKNNNNNINNKKNKNSEIIDKISKDDDDENTSSSINSNNNNINNNNNKIDRNKFTKFLNENINQILTYWQDITTRHVPSYFWRSNDCYFLLGGKDDRNNLIDILPIPMYIDESHYNNLFNSNEIKNLVNHLNSCRFVQNQFFPLVNKELFSFKDDNNKRKLSNCQKSKEKKRKRNQSFSDEDDDDTQFRKLVDADRTTKKLNLKEEINREINEGINNHDNVYVKDNEEEEVEEDDIIKRIWGYKLMLRNMTRYQYHRETVNNFSENKLELVKLVKYFVIDQMCDCYKDMTNSHISKDILNKYVQGEYALHRDQQILHIAEVLHKGLLRNPLSAQLSDIKPKEMTRPQCDCPISKTFLYLLQIFGYDVAGIRYVLALIVLAICYGKELSRKELSVFLGDTNCGKTRFLKILINVLDGLAGIISPRTCYYGTHQDRTHDIGKKADTARLWYIDEVSNREYNREFFNQLTGNSPLFIRTNYTEGRMIKIAPTVLIFGNNSPIFNENCPALIERLKFYTFLAEFSFNQPVCFKYSKFPPLSSFEKNQDDITKGMLAVLLHAICFSNCQSPFYLRKAVVDIPKNVKDSTIMYSPAINIVKELIRNCDLVEDSNGVITMKRMVYLINHIPNVFKSIKVATATDAIRFLDQIYPKSIIANTKLSCSDFYKDADMEFSLVYLGLTERNERENDEKIMDALRGIKRRKK